METLSVVLPILLYILLAALLVALIILTIKVIQFMDKANTAIDNANKVISNVEEKINSFNGLFMVMSKVSDSVVGVGDKIIEGISGVISRIFKSKRKKKNIEEDVYEEN